MPLSGLGVNDQFLGWPQAQASRQVEYRVMHPADLILDLETGILDCLRHAVIGARPGKRQQVSARLSGGESVTLLSTV